MLPTHTTQDMQAALAGMLWVTGNKAGAKESCDALGGEASLKTFVDAQQVSFGMHVSVMMTVGTWSTWFRSTTEPDVLFMIATHPISCLWDEFTLVHVPVSVFI